MENNIQLFENRKIRTAWDNENEEWYFSVSDVVEILTDSKDVKQYIKKMRSRDPELNLKWGTICTPVEMIANDGKKRKIQAADTKGILRIIQSIPSPKAEPFKQWLAQVGAERIEETIDPELIIDEWDNRGVKKGVEYAILTDEITKAWSGMTTRKYKNLKGLTKENLRDNMSTLELVLNMLAEATTTEFSKELKPATFDESREIARRGGKVAGDARKNIEATTNKSVTTSKNAAELNKIVTGLISDIADNADTENEQ